MAWRRSQLVAQTDQYQHCLRDASTARDQHFVRTPTRPIIAVRTTRPTVDAWPFREHQLFCLRTRLDPNGDSFPTREFVRPAHDGMAISPCFHKRSRHEQGTASEDCTAETASDQVFLESG